MLWVSAVASSFDSERSLIEDALLLRYEFGCFWRLFYVDLLGCGGLCGYEGKVKDPSEVWAPKPPYLILVTFCYFNEFSRVFDLVKRFCDDGFVFDSL